MRRDVVYLDASVVRPRHARPRPRHRAHRTLAAALEYRFRRISNRQTVSEVALKVALVARAARPGWLGREGTHDQPAVREPDHDAPPRRVRLARVQRDGQGGAVVLAGEDDGDAGIRVSGGALPRGATAPTEPRDRDRAVRGAARDVLASCVERHARHRRGVRFFFSRAVERRATGGEAPRARTEIARVREDVHAARFRAEREEVLARRGARRDVLLEQGRDARAEKAVLQRGLVLVRRSLRQPPLDTGGRDRARRLPSVTLILRFRAGVVAQPPRVRVGAAAVGVRRGHHGVHLPTSVPSPRRLPAPAGPRAVLTAPLASELPAFDKTTTRSATAEIVRLHASTVHTRARGHQAGSRSRRGG